jgi:metallo-beta-lactamase family protein
MDIKLKFMGAAGNVTGSRFLLQANGTTLLIDCGFFQERQFQERNWEPFAVPPSQIDAVLLTHAHLDHCGLLPKLVREGFSGKIYCTGATGEIARVVIQDSAKIQMEDAKYKRKRHAKKKYTPPRPVEPLYEPQDALACDPLFATVDYEQPLQLPGDMEATYYNAGHILGSAMIKLDVRQSGEKRTVLFSGDIGRWNVPILQDPTLMEQADYVLCESTYGDRLHQTNTDIKERLAAVINETDAAGGNIIIPSFAVERSQELLYYLNELVVEDRIPNLLTFLDSPMAVKVTDVFRKYPDLYDKETIEHLNDNNSPFSFAGLQMTPQTSQSKAINHIRGTVIIIAGSGMCTGGRVKHHLVNNISRPESTVLFVGYQAVGTLGRSLLDGPEKVRIFGEKRDVKARIERLSGFSGHADRDEIERWLSSLKKQPKKLFLIHGEEESSKALAQYLKENKGWQAIVPNYMDEVTLD